MSRSGYTDAYDDSTQWDFIRWQGATKSAIRGKRGQSFLKEMLDAFDKLPRRGLIKKELRSGQMVCALGAVGKARGVEMKHLDPEDHEAIANTFGISDTLAREIMWQNDDGSYSKEKPAQRFKRMRQWVVDHIKE